MQLLRCAGAPNQIKPEIMESLIAELRRSQDKALLLLEQSTTNELERIEGTISVLQGSLQKLREQLQQHKFIDPAKEIHFFKNQLPAFQSELVYAILLEKIERQKPEGTTVTQKQYYQNWLARISRFFVTHKDFYEYVRKGATFLDENYFLRERDDPFTIRETFSFALDRRFCTTASFTLSRILAHGMLQQHLNDCLDLLSGRAKQTTFQDFGLQWTQSPMALKEMVYAHFYDGSFNKGKAEIKQLAAAFSAIYGVKLDNIWRAKQEMYYRSNMSQYIDQLRKRFIDGMQETEDRRKKK
jgi:hypothetical protein